MQAKQNIILEEIIANGEDSQVESVARNPMLVKYMENIRYMDRLGRGIPMILREMKQMGRREPLLEESDEEFVLRLYF